MSLFTAHLVGPPLGCERRGERRRLYTTAQCRRGSARETVEVLDISPAGARVRAIAPLRAGFSVWIKLPGLAAREARVVWTIGFESGCEFSQALHPAVFDSLTPPAAST
jgi:hypothetical protein